MSTFSSVVRKSGQPIKPRSVPRRSVQRHAQKVAATTTLTPENTPYASDIPSDALLEENEVDRGSDKRLKQAQQDVVRTLTPPPTEREATSPASVIEDAPAVSDVAPGPPPPAEGGVGGAADVSAPTPRSELDTDERRKRRVNVLDGVSAPVQPQDKHNDSGFPVIRAPDSSAPPSKRRKVAPQAAPSYLLSRPDEPPSRAQTATPASPRDSSIAAERVRASTEDLLHQATSQFDSISKIAESIETQTRRLRPRATRTSYADAEDDDIATGTNRQRSRASAISDLASAVIDQAADTSASGNKRRSRRRSRPSLEDAESHEIDVSSVSMSDLTKDSGLGKRSDTGKQLDESWTEIQQRWREGPEENRRKATEKTHAERQARKEKAKKEAKQIEPSFHPDLHPNVQIIGEQLVLNPDSQQVAFSGDIAERAQREESTAREYRKVDNYVTSARVGKWAGLRPNARWDDDSTDLLYKGLRMFGTDFEMIATLFPTRSRPEIVLKYKREAKATPKRVEESILNREEVDLEVYREMAGDEGEWEDPKTFIEELEAQKVKALADQDRRWKEGRFEDPSQNEDDDEADIPLPSTEIDEGGNEIVAEITDVPAVSEHRRRIREIAGDAIAQATMPAAKKRTRRTRESAATTGKAAAQGSRGKKAKQTLEGVEEVVGSLRDVEQ